MPGIIFFYLRLIFRANRKGSDPSGLSGWCLLHKKSFRTSQGGFGPAQVTGRLFRTVFARKKSGVRNYPGERNGIAVWDNRDVSQIRYDHIVFNGGQTPSFFIERNGLQITGSLRVVTVLIYFMLWPFLTLWALFSKHSANIALLYDEWTEAIALMQVVKHNKISYIYFYCPYEADANALYLLLHREGVTVNKIPSPNLLAAHNQEVLSDSITLSSPCQADELHTYRDTIKVGEIIKWFPEQFAAYADVYRNERREAQRFTLGYYSHASWFRTSEGKVSEVGDVEAEFALLRTLKQILNVHPQFRCVVFLHPKEKRADVFPQTQEYYNDQIGTGKYVFADVNVAASRIFDSVDIGVGALSTILFERLFLGNKTIFFPAGIKIFPVPESSLRAICPVSASELESIILQCAEESTRMFLEKRDLRKYTIFNWKPESGYAEQN